MTIGILLAGITRLTLLSAVLEQVLAGTILAEAPTTLLVPLVLTASHGFRLRAVLISTRLRPILSWQALLADVLMELELALLAA